jgi:hypothetical protein
LRSEKSRTWQTQKIPAAGAQADRACHKECQSGSGPCPYLRRSHCPLACRRNCGHGTPQQTRMASRRRLASEHRL